MAELTPNRLTEQLKSKAAPDPVAHIILQTVDEIEREVFLGGITLVGNEEIGLGMTKEHVGLQSGFKAAPCNHEPMQCPASRKIFGKKNRTQKIFSACSSPMKQEILH